MKTSKRLLQRRLNNKLAPYFFEPVKQPTLMQYQYRNWSCILDPAIALSHHGVIIAENLSKEIELWIVQELWNIINDAEFYSDRTELIVPQDITLKTEAVVAETIWSLQEWSKTKQEQDLAKLGMYWLGDNLQESLLPHNKPIEIFKRWEALGSSLDRRERQTNSNDKDILTMAFRDTLALAASLKSAFILTYQPSNENTPPAICKALSNWGISCQIIVKRNPIAAMERQYIRQLIVRAGLGKLLLAGVNLAAFHLVIPAVNTSANAWYGSSLSTSTHYNNGDREIYFWNNVRGIWYYI